MWKILKKLWPKSGTSDPTAERNHMGKILSGAHEIKSQFGPFGTFGTWK